MRRIRRTRSFARNLRGLARQHRDLPGIVTETLKKYAVEGVSDRYRQNGVEGLPIFKERLRLRGTGKRGGARIIVYCDAQIVVALFIFTKSGTKVVPGGKIRRAFRTAGLGLLV